MRKERLMSFKRLLTRCVAILVPCVLLASLASTASAHGATSLRPAAHLTGPAGSYLYDDAVNPQLTTASGCSAGWQVDPSQSGGGATGITSHIAPSTGSSSCYKATWSDLSFTEWRACYVDAWVSLNANGNVTYQFWGRDGTVFYSQTLNQANTPNGWHQFVNSSGIAIGFNDLISVTITSNTGYTSNRGNVADHWIGAAGMDFTCQFTPYVPYSNLQSNPNNCGQLGLDGTPTPFSGASQIPGSTAFAFTTPLNYSVAPCQTATGNEINSANWDGYGNPFQCVELILRYTALRYGITPTDWITAGAGNAYTLYAHHPPQFTATPYFASGNGSIPHAGDIMLWNQDAAMGDTAGHVAIVTAVDTLHKTITVMDENAFFQGMHTSKRVFGYYYEAGIGYTIDNFYDAYGGASGAYLGWDYIYPQDHSQDTLMGWLHSTL